MRFHLLLKKLIKTKMKKILLICISTLFLTACADKQQYEQAVLTNMEEDQDIKDYKIDPNEMMECVVEFTSKEMPGSFSFDPDRLTSYQNYSKMLSMTNVPDKKAMLEELRSLFGTPRALADAHRNYAESVMNCIDVIVKKSEEDIVEETNEEKVSKETEESNPQKP